MLKNVDIIQNAIIFQCENCKTQITLRFPADFVRQRMLVSPVNSDIIHIYCPHCPTVECFFLDAADEPDKEEDHETRRGQKKQIGRIRQIKALIPRVKDQ